MVGRAGGMRLQRPSGACACPAGSEDRSRCRLAVEASNDGVWELMLETGEVWLSSAALALFGVAAEGAPVGLPWFQARCSEGLWTQLQALLTPGAELDAEGWVDGGVQGPRWLRFRGAARVVDGVCRRVGTVRDLSAHRHTLERMEQATRELEAKNEALDAFATAASHDLREPLRKISAFIGRAARQGAITEPRTLDYLQRADRSARRLSTMVEDLLALTRVPAQADLRGMVDVHESVDLALEALAPVVASAEARVEVDLRLPPVVANPVHVRQVIVNLLDNALKYRHPERPAEVCIRGRCEGRLARVEVLDNGIGFSDADLGRMFRLFGRLHGPSDYPGTGLGLALCSKVVAQYGGELEAEGRPGEGALFRFTLPLAGEPGSDGVGYS